jgi:predicted amidohydrolase
MKSIRAPYRAVGHATLCRMTTVALAQVRVDDDEPVADRVDRVVQWTTTQAGRAGPVDLLVLPELWQVGAFSTDRVLAHAEPVGGPFTTRMSRLANTLGCVVHAGSFPEAHAGGVSNTSLVFAPDGSLLAHYRKIHLFGFDTGEAVTVAAGDESVAVATPLGVTGLTTCYDLRFPELYRELVDHGAEAFLVPAGWPQARMSHWRILAQARAVENQAVVMACNAVGTTGEVRMGGGSVMVAADGEVLARAGKVEEELLIATVDATQTTRWREVFPALRDRRHPAGGDRVQRGEEFTED